MKEGNDGFVRADQIDLKSLDEQLERHLNRVWTMENNSKKQDQLSSSFNAVTPTVVAATSSAPARQRQEWEIDPAKLIIKTVLARGTFGTVHRGIYDGLDVAGQFSYQFGIRNCTSSSIFT